MARRPRQGLGPHVARRATRVNSWSCYQVADLSMGDLLLHTSVSWINPPPSLGKWKKEPQMATFGTTPFSLTHDGGVPKMNLMLTSTFFWVAYLLVFKTAVVFVCKDGSKHKKKMVSGCTAQGNELWLLIEIVLVFFLVSRAAPIVCRCLPRKKTPSDTVT